MPAMFRYTLMITTLCLSANLAAAEAEHWSYGEGKNGPAHWGELDAKFAACSTGKSQSPVNLTGMIEGHYRKSNSTIRWVAS